MMQPAQNSLTLALTKVLIVIGTEQLPHSHFMILHVALQDTPKNIMTFPCPWTGVNLSV